MDILKTKDELRQRLAQEPSAKTIGFVPTMGYLHEGHLSLIQNARQQCDIVVTSIFVNPTQFGENEDLDTYPRDEEGDAQKCREQHVDILWLPHADEVYASDHATTVTVQGLTSVLCGASRPTHFDGVTTIVSKLFHIVQPDIAFFGRKDYQQLAIIRRMVRDLDIPVKIIGVPIVRENDGLALSSRNSYLSDEERQAGLLLSQALSSAQKSWQNGERSVEKILQIMTELIDASDHTSIDYIAVVDPYSLQSLAAKEHASTQEEALAALAVHIGSTRLIDNARLDGPPVLT